MITTQTVCSGQRWNKLNLRRRGLLSHQNKWKIMSKIVAVTLIIIGTALIAWGYNHYEAFGAQLTRALDGSTPAEAWIGMIGGGFCLALGLFKIK
jgi:uncharacterized membrane protein YidH (DUF202 family)